MLGSTFDDTTTEAHAGLRLDVYLAGAIEDVSRSIIQKLIKDGLVEVNGVVCKKPGRTVAANERVTAILPTPPSSDLTPQAIPLSILYEDSDLLVIDKPSGLVVHPAPGHSDGTLVNAVLYHCPDFQRPGDDLGRPGIVHRLDRFTSGVMVVAKSHVAFAGLAEQAREHTFDRRYLALVRGEFKENVGRINASVGRSLHDRGRMSVTGVNARDAITRFEVLERFRVASLVSLVLETGRTHQIRVHMRFAGHPVLGDPVYGVTEFGKWDVPDSLLEALNALEGQALHAERLGFTHPVSKERLTFTADPPADFQRTLEALRALHSSR
ncbi:MAG: RluA family pseudouridine synthase [Candidatus Hydrogenedentes bacterium]|nr:RluA family pseudouridine synthase [Candidatus Hydrogenedentota bacterium]